MRICRSPYALSVFLLLGLLLCGLHLAWQPHIVHAQQPSPTFDINAVTMPLDPPNAGRGRTLYAQNCAPCHGPSGQGDGPTAESLPAPPTAFADPDASWQKSPAQWFHTTKFGRRENLMPPWQNQMSDEQIWQTVMYAWSLHTAAGAVDAGAELYAASCASCHGATGAGDGPDAPADMPDFADITANLARSPTDWQDGWQTAHADIGADWSAAQQRSVLAYMRTFAYTPPWETSVTESSAGEASYQPGRGLIRGRVMQGTPGGRDVAGLTVALEAFVDFQPVAAFTTTLDADGEFEFGELAVDPNTAYLASVSVDGISYSSPILTLTAAEPTTDTDITIYERSDDPSGIRIERAHWIMESQPGVLLVGQIIAFSNAADRAFVGRSVEGADEPVTVALHAPAEAVDVGFENGELGGRFQRVGNVIYDTAPVVPGTGTRQLVMRYTVPHDGGDMELLQDFAYPVQTLNLLVNEQPQLQVEASALTPAGSQELQGTPYNIWMGTELPPAPLVVTLSGLLAPDSVAPPAAASGASTAAPGPAAESTPPLDPWLPWATGGIVVVGLASAAVWSWRQGADASAADINEATARQRQALIQRIARLDDLHAVGDVSDADWQRQRAQLKSQLLRIAATEEFRV